MRRRRRRQLTDRQIDRVWGDACDVLAYDFGCTYPLFKYADIVQAAGLPEGRCLTISQSATAWRLRGTCAITARRSSCIKRPHMTGQTIKGARVKRDLSKHPRVKRKKPPPEDWRDPYFLWCEPGSTLERFRRTELFRHFQKFVRENGGWITSIPAGRVTVQVPKDSPLIETLRSLKRYPVAEIPGNATRLTHGAFVPVDTVEVILWRN